MKYSCVISPPINSSRLKLQLCSHHGLSKTKSAQGHSLFISIISQLEEGASPINQLKQSKYTPTKL